MLNTSRWEHIPILFRAKSVAHQTANNTIIYLGW